MDDKIQKMGEKLQANTQGHGLGDRDLGRKRDDNDNDAGDGITRKPRSGSESSNEGQSRTEPTQSIPGNTSETGQGTPTSTTGTPQTRTRSPLGPGAGCLRQTGTMFIASVSLVAIALRIKKA